MARILLVDDEPDVRLMLRDALKLRGHSVNMASGSDQALKLAKDNNYEVAIIDYVLPGKRGLDLLQELRGLQPFLRSIIISGQIDHEVLDAVELEKQLKEQIAADRYLPKPISTDGLNRAIQEVLSMAADVDWQQMAAAAVAGQEVSRKQVKAMDRSLRKARKRK